MTATATITTTTQAAATPARPMRVLFALPGLHRVNRGAEVAFESVAAELAKLPGCEVTLIGSGELREGEPYRFHHVNCRPRERFEKWPHLPLLRNEYVYEELSFAPGLWRQFKPGDFDLTVTCSYPFTNWVLRAKKHGGRRLPHVYVTQNGDWPAQARNSEYRAFHCNGLVCTNPDYFDRNSERWPCALIPNGVDPSRFSPGAGDRRSFDLSADAPVALIVSALIASKRVIEGIHAAAGVEGMHLVVAGDGPLRDEVEQMGRAQMGERFQRVSVPRERMPELYRCADVFLHMSLDEPSANSYIEALATGLPIVTHDRRVTRWTLEDTSLLVDATDGRAVTEALSQALSMCDAGHVQRRRELATTRFAWSSVARQYHAFFQQVIDRG